MMKIIGITGGVGSGKSRVLTYVKEKYHAVICQADHVAWELQLPQGRCYSEIIEAFGTEILNDDKIIDRKQLGEIVFRNDDKLKLLNEIMHPAVKKEIRQIICKEKQKGTKLFFLEAALLIEEHYDEICDELWYIKTDDAIRRDRLKHSRNYSDEKIDLIMASQLSEEVFMNKCQRVVNNDASFDETCTQLDEIIRQLGVL